RRPRSPLVPYTTLFRSPGEGAVSLPLRPFGPRSMVSLDGRPEARIVLKSRVVAGELLERPRSRGWGGVEASRQLLEHLPLRGHGDRKSTRLNSSHGSIS